jgi:hypothetical protein
LKRFKEIHENVLTFNGMFQVGLQKLGVGVGGIEKLLLQIQIIHPFPHLRQLK